MDGRMVVLVSGSGSNLAALADACGNGRVAGAVVGVAADRRCTGIERAAALGIPTAVCAPGSHGSRGEWSEALRDVVAAWRPELVVSAGFMRILGPEFVDAFPHRLINLHPSLLPAFPGAHAVRDALEYGVKVTGTTVHVIDHEVDHGPILLQVPVEVRAGDSEQTLHERIKQAEHRILPEACRMMLEGKVRIEGRRALVAPEGGSPL